MILIILNKMMMIKHMMINFCTSELELELNFV